MDEFIRMGFKFGIAFVLFLRGTTIPTPAIKPFVFATSVPDIPVRAIKFHH